jgi:hypothetical protein
VTGPALALKASANFLGVPPPLVEAQTTLPVALPPAAAVVAAPAAVVLALAAVVAALAAVVFAAAGAVVAVLSPQAASKAALETPRPTRRTILRRVMGLLGLLFSSIEKFPPL